MLAGPRDIKPMAAHLGKHERFWESSSSDNERDDASVNHTQAGHDDGEIGMFSE
jgi:hypothetical protein